MKKTAALGMFAGLILAGLTTEAGAALTTIGEATYTRGTLSTNHSLIWDDNNNGNSVVWLDYTNNAAFSWSKMTQWATGLNAAGVLSYTLNTGYSVDWGTNAWRLPASVDGNYVYSHLSGNTGLGYSNTTSELGHLYYTELGNNPYRNPDGTYNSQTGNYGLLNDGDFKNLKSTSYWSGTEASGAPYYGLSAWYFGTGNGLQYVGMKSDPKSAIALRTGQVSYNDPTTTPTPIPGAVVLFGSGLLGLVGLRRSKKHGCPRR